MATALEDISKSNKQRSRPTNPRGRVPRNAGPGPSRRIPNRFANRTIPYSKVPSMEPPSDTTRQRDVFMEDGGPYPPPSARVSFMDSGIKVLIANLDYGVADEDIEELFSEVGDIKRYSVHYDKSGRSKGTAEVVFSRRVDALQAVKKYNNVQLDGKPMKVEIVGPTNALNHAPARPITNAMYGKQISALRSGQGRTGGTRQARGSGRGRRGRGWNRNRGK